MTIATCVRVRAVPGRVERAWGGEMVGIFVSGGALPKDPESIMDGEFIMLSAMAAIAANTTILGSYLIWLLFVGKGDRTLC